MFKRFARDETGATAIEYGLICGILAASLIGIAATGGALEGVYQKVSLIIGALGGEDGGGDGG